MRLRAKKRQKKMIPFIHNCPVHPQIDNFTNIKLAFLPPNTTSVILPIDQRIITTLKRYLKEQII